MSKHIDRAHMAPVAAPAGVGSYRRMSHIVGEEEAGAEAENRGLESYLDQRGFEFELEAAQIRSSGGDAGGSRERERQGLLFPSLRRCFEPSRWEGDGALI